MYSVSKRLIDVIVAVALGAVMLPVMAAVALLLWIVQGKILFCQQRPGLHGRPFTLYKFCSMSEARGEQGALLPDEQRLTTIGSLLRSLSVDELPQLFNVLRGDMSLVGPRPLLMQYLPRYSAAQARRHEVKPGISGWAQVMGRNSLDWEHKFALDLWYVENRSFSLDMKILSRTAWIALRRKGISNEGHSTMPEFLGEMACRESSQAGRNLSS